MIDDDFLLITDEEDEYKKILKNYKGDVSKEVEYNNSGPLAGGDQRIDDSPLPADGSGQTEQTEQEDGTPADSSDYSDQLLSHQIAFTIKGTKSWNTKEPYLIDIDYKKLQEETEELAECFVFLENAVSDINELNQFLKNEAQKKIFNKNSFAETYQLFLFKTIAKEIETIITAFGIPKELKNIFIYHLGPLCIFQLLITEYTTQQTGHCYRLMNDRRIKQVLPSEYIKKSILQWYEANINTLKIQFDDVNLFDSVRSIVSKKYHDRYKDLQIKMYELKKISATRGKPVKSGISKKVFFGEKNIILYKRFLQRTIF